MDCHADDREALGDFERFFNNSAFSDVTLLVGEEIFDAHRLILIKTSEVCQQFAMKPRKQVVSMLIQVFERMLSQQWSGDKKVRVSPFHAPFLFRLLSALAPPYSFGFWQKSAIS